jgi:hypothetical protein
MTLCTPVPPTVSFVSEDTTSNCTEAVSAEHISSNSLYVVLILIFSPIRFIEKNYTDFAYLCKDFGLKRNSVEDMVSPKVSETLANEVGAKTEKIYTK